MDCGVFCVNHLLGGRYYESSDFKEICYELSDDFINPHKHFCGGDYSIDVLMVALQKKGYDSRWHDARKEFALES